MITIFNRAELFVDVNQEAAAKVWSTLKANGIEYEMSTKQDVSTLRKNIHYSQGMNVGHGGIPASYFGDAPTYVYKIYVKRSDLERARGCARCEGVLCDITFCGCGNCTVRGGQCSF